MSETYTITVKDKNVEEVEVIKKKCEEMNVSFSAFIVDAIIEYKKKVFK